MIYLVFAETALELIPRILWNNPKIKAYSKKRGKHASKLLLDSSKFYFLMKEIEDFNKRGRPDIIHFCLLYALGSELNKKDKLRIYVHTLNDYVIKINSDVRLPRNYSRFTGLIEQLFEKGEIKDSDNDTLLALTKMSLTDLINDLNCDKKILLKEGHKKISEVEIKKMIDQNLNLCFIIGAFPHGNFVNETINLAQDKFSISDYLLDTWNVTGKLLTLCEIALGL